MLLSNKSSISLNYKYKRIWSIICFDNYSIFCYISCRCSSNSKNNPPFIQEHNSIGTQPENVRLHRRTLPSRREIDFWKLSLMEKWIRFCIIFQQHKLDINRFMCQNYQEINFRYRLRPSEIYKNKSKYPYVLADCPLHVWKISSRSVQLFRPNKHPSI